MTDRVSARRTRLIAIASGKGGVGKTNITINLAVTLARVGRKVVVLDGDLGLANVDVLLGITPKATLHNVVFGDATLSDVLTPAPGGFWIVPGASGLEDLANLNQEARLRLMGSLQELDGRADFLLIDTAAGISFEVSSFLLASPEVLLVTTPEPTAITDAYALLKVVLQAAERQREQGIPTNPIFRLVVNQVNDVGEARAVANKISIVTREFLGIEVEMLGHIPADHSIGRAVRQQSPVTLAYPNAPSSLHFVELARRLCGDNPAIRESESGIMSFLKRMAARQQRRGQLKGLGDGRV